MTAPMIGLAIVTSVGTIGFTLGTITLIGRALERATSGRA